MGAESRCQTVWSRVNTELIQFVRDLLVLLNQRWFYSRASVEHRAIHYSFSPPLVVVHPWSSTAIPTLWPDFAFPCAGVARSCKYWFDVRNADLSERHNDRRSQFAASLLCPPFDGTALRPARQESRRTRLFVPPRPRIQRFHSPRRPSIFAEGFIRGIGIRLAKLELLARHCARFYDGGVSFRGCVAWTVVECSLSGSIWGRIKSFGRDQNAMNN